MHPSRAFVILTAFVSSIVADNSQTTCPEQCMCFSGLEFEVDCQLNNGSLSIRIQPEDYLSVTCQDITTLSIDEVPLLAILKNSTIPSIGFIECPVPEEGWADTIRAFGASDTHALTIRHPPEGSERAKRAHFTGLALKSLTLVSATPIELPADFFSDLPQLQRLVIRGSKLKLSADMFSTAPPLERLELADAGITSIPAHTFRGLATLKHLGLWRNAITNLSKESLEGLTMLEDIDLSSNLLREISNGTLNRSTRLRRIALFANEIRKLKSAAFEGLIQLQELVLFDNKVPLEIEERAFSGLTSLASVRLERSKINALPENVFEKSSALQNLSLSGNALKILPQRLLFDQKDLKRLDLSRNGLLVLESEFFSQMKRLRYLNLNRNLLEELPSYLFSSLTNLESLSISRNNLKDVSPTAFNGIDALEDIDLSRNNLSLCEESLSEAGGYIDFGPHSPFNSLMRLRKLNLSKNRLGAICADWRLVLLQLSDLDLSFNDIRKITDADINFLSSKIVVDLRNNSISTVELSDSPIMEEHPSESKILLDNNPFDCDCRAYTLVKRLRGESNAVGQPSIVANDAVCASPLSLSHQPLLEIDVNALSCTLPSSLCPQNCSCFLKPATEILQFDCTVPPQEYLPRPMDFGLRSTALHMKSSVRSINDLHLPEYVTDLYLDGLRIKKLKGTLPKHVQYLDMSNNALEILPNDLLMRNNVSRILLAGNKLKCDCDHADDVTRLFSVRKQVVHWELVECSNGSPLNGSSVVRVSGVDPLALCASRRVLYAVLSIVMAIAVLFSITGCLWWRYRHPIRVWLLNHGIIQRSEDEDKEFDAFVSFSHLDEDFVVEKLMPELEKPPNALKLCVHFRDWVAGEWIPAQITASVEKSRRTIVVLSANFMKSEWGRAEWRAAHARALREKRARVVLVILGELDTAKLEPELQAYLSTNTYVKWGDPWFWDKLRAALPRPRAYRKCAPRSDAAKKKGFEDRLDITSRPKDSPVAALDPAALLARLSPEKVVPPQA